MQTFDRASVQTFSFSLLSINYFEVIRSVQGHAVTQLVETLRYKPEGRGFDFRWRFIGIFR